MRRHDLPDVDDALESFYLARISNVSSLAELDRFLRGLPSQDVLHLTEPDLVGGLELSYDEHAFPDSVNLHGQEVPLSYAYTPGEEQDGVTLRMPAALVSHTSVAQVQWAVPGLRVSQVAELLRGLPKSLRRELMPLQPKAEEIASELKPASKSLTHELSQYVLREYGVQVPPSAWPLDQLPLHLRPRVEVFDSHQRTLGVGRDLAALQAQLTQAPSQPAGVPNAWKQAASKWERFAITDWNFGDPPEKVGVGGAKSAVRSPKSEVETVPDRDRSPGRSTPASEASEASTKDQPAAGSPTSDFGLRTSDFPHATSNLPSAHAWLTPPTRRGKSNLRLSALPPPQNRHHGRLPPPARNRHPRDLAWLHKDCACFPLRPLAAGWITGTISGRRF